MIFFVIASTAIVITRFACNSNVSMRRGGGGESFRLLLIRYFGTMKHLCIRLRLCVGAAFPILCLIPIFVTTLSVGFLAFSLGFDGS